MGGDDNKKKDESEEKDKPDFPTLSRIDSVKAIGTYIGPYELLSVLGEGGFGIVYHAEQKRPIRRQVALKVIKPGMDFKQVVARFESERQALALLDHPNIARVFDGGTTESGWPYFVMELVMGLSITEYCDKHKLSIEERLELFRQVCDAVQHAHQKGIIHRDIKPSNILVPVRGEKPVPMIIDFGVAKAISQPLTECTLFTEQGQFIGTPEYMSPEQAGMTIENVDTRSDIYSLGVVFYELITGTLPFSRDELHRAGFVEIQRIIREVDPPRPSTRLSSLGEEAKKVADRRHTEFAALAKRLHKELEWIPLKAMRKEPDRRYKTASELADDIQNYLSGNPLIAGPESVTYRLKKAIKRHRVFFASVAASLVVLGAAALILTIFARRVGEAEKVRDEAVQDANEALNVLLGDPARQALASTPRPANGSVNINPSKNMLLMWIPARNVSEQRVYFGLYPTNLELLKTLKQQNFVQLPELKQGWEYYWRVDGTRSDGSPVVGELWNFSTGNLVYWSKFDETEGNTAKDSSGYGHHARLANGPEWQRGRFGGALSFDGKDDYVDVGMTASQLGISGNSQRTVAMWVFVRGFQHGGIFAMGRYSFGREFALRTTSSENYYEIRYYGPGYEQTFSIDSNNKWTHLAVVHDGTETKVYANGSLVLNFAKTINTGDDIQLVFGRWSSRYYYKGLIDDFRIYNYALNETQIKALHSGSKPERVIAPDPCDGKNLGRGEGRGHQA